MKGRRGPLFHGHIAKAVPAMATYIIVLMVLSTIPVLLPGGPTAAQAQPEGRIIVISNETAIPIAIGTPGTGLTPFSGILTNRVGIHITGQVVDGNYTPIWQPGSMNNLGIDNVQVQWSFWDEPDRAHTITTDADGLFAFFLTPEVDTPETGQLRFWFDGRSDAMYGIPIHPAAEVVYDISIAETVHLTVEPVQSKAMTGDTIIVEGRLTDKEGSPLEGEGLMAFFDNEPAQENPHAGWYIDNVILGPYNEDFEDGQDGFENGGKRSPWSAGMPATGPKGGSTSINCAGTVLDGNYEYDTDTTFTSPTVDLSEHGSATLMFDSWADLAPEDRLFIELSNDNGLTWPVRKEVPPSGPWTSVDMQVGTFHNTPYGVVDFGHRDQVKIRFRLTTNTLPLETDEDGRYEFLYRVPDDMEVGPATVMVEHPASDRFAATTSSAQIGIAKWTTLEVVVTDEMYRGVPVEVRARLLDTDGQLLEREFPGYHVEAPHVKVWLQKGSVATYLGERAVDDDGYVALGYEPPRDGPLGPASMRFRFEGNGFYAPAEVTQELVFRAHTEVDILSPTDASLLTGESIEITGTVNVIRTESLNDVAQDPVSKRDVIVMLNDEEIGTATTDEEGRFTLFHDVKGADINLGNAVIRVMFPGDLVYQRSEDAVDFSILSTTMIQATPRTIKKGTTAIMDGTLTSYEGGVQGIVEIHVDGELYKKVVSGSSGRFATTFDVPWDMETGPVQMTFYYLGNDVNRPASTTVEYIVGSDTMILVEEGPLETHRGNSLAIKGRLVDSWDGEAGPAIAGALVEMTLPDGSRAQALTGLNGNFSHYYTVPNDLAVGRTEVIITFIGEHRTGSKATLDLDVTSPTSMRFLELEDRVEVDSTTPMKVALTDDAGSPVTGEMVRVYLLGSDGETLLFEGPTDSAGVVAFKSRFNTTGTLTLVARYDGNRYLETSEGYDYISVGPALEAKPPLHRQPTVVLGGSLITVIFLALVATESGKYFLFKLLLVPMYTKLKKTDVLDHFVRGQIYGLIRMQPGAHYNLIKKRLDLKNGVLSYHLSTLEREGFILSELDGIYKRFFPNHVKFEVDYPIFLSKIQERIIDFVKRSPGSTQKEVAKELALSTSTVNDNIKVLSQAKLLELKREGKRTRCYMAEG